MTTSSDPRYPHQMVERLFGTTRDLVRQQSELMQLARELGPEAEAKLSLVLALMSVHTAQLVSGLGQLQANLPPPPTTVGDPSLAIH